MVMIDDYHHMAWGVAQPHTPCAHGWQAPLHQVTESGETSPRKDTSPGWVGWDNKDAAMRERRGARSSPKQALLQTRHPKADKRH